MNLSNWEEEFDKNIDSFEVTDEDCEGNSQTSINSSAVKSFIRYLVLATIDEVKVEKIEPLPDFAPDHEWNSAIDALEAKKEELKKKFL